MDVSTQILVRTEVPPLNLLHSIAAQINRIDSDQQLNRDVRDLEHLIHGQPEWQQERLVAWLFGAFAAVALALAVTGLYSAVSYTVAQRTGEFGIRMALGAQQTQLLALVYKSALLSIGCGIGAGVILTLALDKVIEHWVEGSSHDPAMLAGVTLLLALVGVVACAIPARRASTVDPMVALRD